jgi:hypothetical protein
MGGNKTERLDHKPSVTANNSRDSRCAFRCQGKEALFGSVVTGPHDASMQWDVAGSTACPPSHSMASSNQNQTEAAVMT